MRPLLRHLIAVALLLSLTAVAGAQAGRYIPIPVRPPPTGLPFSPHLPVHVGGGSGDGHIWLYVVLGLGALVVLVVRVIAALGESATSKPDPDLIHSAGKVAPKAARTRRLMEFLAYRERLFDPTALRAWAEGSFLRVQECWQKADYGPLGDLLRPSLRAAHERQMAAMRANGERNVLRELNVERLEFVHLDCPADPDQQEVTALITFRAASSYVAAGTGAFRRGSQVPALFQEFWVFRRQGDAWHLEWIERSNFSDRLTRPNRAEGLSEDQFHHTEDSVAL
jgi:Tim44-like domain